MSIVDDDFNSTSTSSRVIIHEIDASAVRMRDLLTWVCENLIKERMELFVQGETM